MSEQKKRLLKKKVRKEKRVFCYESECMKKERKQKKQYVLNRNELQHIHGEERQCKSSMLTKSEHN